MAKLKDDRMYRYVVKINTNGHLVTRTFEATYETLSKAAEDYLDYVRGEMFGLDGTYYFQRRLEVCFEWKLPEQGWEKAQQLNIFNEQEDLEHHLLNWEDEATFIPDLPKAKIKLDGSTYNVLSQNELLYQVVGELKEFQHQ